MEERGTALQKFKKKKKKRGKIEIEETGSARLQAAVHLSEGVRSAEWIASF